MLTVVDAADHLELYSLFRVTIAWLAASQNNQNNNHDKSEQIPDTKPRQQIIHQKPVILLVQQPFLLLQSILSP